MAYIAALTNGNAATLATWNTVVAENSTPFNLDTLSAGTIAMVPVAISGVALYFGPVDDAVTVEAYDGVTLIDSATLTPEADTWTFFPLTTSGATELKIVTTATGTIGKNGDGVLYLAADASHPASLSALLAAPLYVVGRLVTWDVTATDTCPALYLAGQLAFPATAATDYKLKATLLRLYSNGILNAQPDGTSTAEIAFTTLTNNGLLTLVGATKTAWTTLTATAASASNVLSVNAATGWAIGDELILAPLSNYVNTDTVDVTSVSGTTIGVNSLIFSHNGEVANTSRNVSLTGDALNNFGEISAHFVRFDLQDFYSDSDLTLLGSHVRGICDLSGTVTLTSCTFELAPMTGIGLDIANCLFFGSYVSLEGCTVANCVVTACEDDEAAILGNGTYTTLLVHTNSGVGVQLESPALSVIFTDLVTTYNTIGLKLQGILTPANVHLVNFQANANSVAHISIEDRFIGQFVIDNATMVSGGAPTAIRFADNCSEMTINNSDLGSTGSAYGDGDITVTQPSQVVVFCKNCLFSPSVFTTASQSNLRFASQVASDRHNRVAGVYYLWQQNGKSEVDVLHFVTPSVSERITPRSPNRVEVGKFEAYVKTGNALYVSVLMRKSADYNGDPPQLVLKANAEIGYKEDVVLAEATALSNEAWEMVAAQLPAATNKGIATMAVRVNGTAGYVNLDEFTASQYNVDDGHMEMFRRGMPIARIGNTKSKGNVASNTGTFIVRTTLSGLSSPRTLLLGYSQANATLEIEEVHITNSSVRYHQQLIFGIRRLTNSGLAKGTVIPAESVAGTSFSQATWVKDLLIEPAAYADTPYHVEGAVNTEGYHYTRERPRIRISPNAGVGICLMTTPSLPFDCECSVVFRQVGG